MNDVILVNKNGQTIETIETLMMYVLDCFGDSSSSRDIESDFYDLLYSEDIIDIENEDFTIENLSDGYCILNSIEPNYWEIE